MNQTVTPPEKKMPPMVKMLTDFGPLIAFFAANSMGGIYWATGVLMASIVAASAVSWMLTGKISTMHIVTLGFVLIFGGLTLWLENETFIKVKVSLVNGLFGSILVGGWLMGKSLLKFVMGEFLKLDDEGWRQLSLRWGLMFFGLAALNEAVWRSVSTDTWVTFKVFGLLAVTMVFGMCQMPFIAKHMIEDEEKSSKS